MLKLSWGKRIALLYGGFVLLIVGMMTICLSQKEELVSEDYYEKELAFQTKIDEMNNANSLSEQVTHTISGNDLIVQFPSQFLRKNVVGEIVFFKPSDSSKDYKTLIQLDKEGKQFISLDKLSKGMYKMTYSWKSNATNYQMEETIVIP
jgi:hypothetical protein